MTLRRSIAASTLAAFVAVTGCSTVPDPPDVVGANYPGTCMPAELSWPTDFLESLPGESSAVGGRIVGLRLEYDGSQWTWRLRSADTASDAFGDPMEDPRVGKESIVDVRTLETLASHQVTLTEAEQAMTGSGAFDAAHRSGETWPSPLIIEMVRVTERGAPVWRITTCDTTTSGHSVMTLP